MDAGKSPEVYSEEVERHVLTRYELCQRLGKGAFGIVWKVIEKKSRTVMALKKCYDAFRSSEDGQATYREVMYLTEMAGHDNIVRLLQVIKGENNRDIYLVFDYMETDLYNLIRADDQHKILQDVHKKYLIYQLLKAVKYLHRYFFSNTRYYFFACSAFFLLCQPLQHILISLSLSLSRFHSLACSLLRAFAAFVHSFMCQR